jgi:hypothetical protein
MRQKIILFMLTIKIIIKHIKSQKNIIEEESKRLIKILDILNPRCSNNFD